ncbi:MAG: DsbA family protein [Gemmatimonadota bacterium]
MPSPIRLYFDYVDPLAWPAEARARELAALGFTVEHIPLELRAPPAPLLAPEELADRQAQAARLGPPGLAPLPRFVPWTRKAHELAMMGREKGVFDRVHTALLTAHLCRALDIGRIDVLVELAAGLGLDRTEAKAVLDVDRHADAIARIREHALSAGIATVPWFMVGERSFPGVPDMAALVHAAQEE